MVELPALAASEVASVDRDLRRGMEARSDQPGASHFYHGEMQMRRYSEATSPVKKFILTGVSCSQRPQR